MMNIDEIIMLVLCMVVFGFIIANYRQLQRFPSIGHLLASFLAFLLGSILTIIEEFAFFEVMNAAEHLCYLASGMLLTKWIIDLYRKPVRIRS